MRILLVVHRIPPYSSWGSENYTIDFASELLKANDVAIFTTIPRRFDGTLERWQYNGIQVYGIKNDYQYLSSFEETYLNKKIETSFLKTLEFFKPDIVHFQHLLFHSLSYIEHVKSFKIPSLLYLHDYWYICPRTQMVDIYGNICDFPSFDRCKYCYAEYLLLYKHIRSKKNLLNKIEKNLLKLRWKGNLLNLWEGFHHNYTLHEYSMRREAVRKYLNMVDIIISPSEWLMSIYRRYGIELPPFLHLNYAINKRRFKQTPKKTADFIRLGYAGAFIPSKGLHILIDAVNKIKKGVKLYIWGEAPSGFEDYEKKIRKASEKNPNIVFKGYIEHKDIHRIYREIDLLVVPSLWYENSPLVIYESLATGTPVVASDIGGIPELVIDRVYGALFRPGDVEQLKTIIAGIIQDRAIIKRWSENIPEMMDIKDHSEKIIRIYESLAE